MNDNKLKNQTLNGEYKVTFKEIKDGEYNIDVDDSTGKSNKVYIVLIAVLVAILLIVVVGMLSCGDTKQVSEKSEANVKEIQGLKQSYTELQDKVDELMKKSRLATKELTSDAEKQPSSNEYYGIKKVNVSEANVTIPNTPKADQKIPKTPSVKQKIPEIPMLIKKIPEVPTVK